MKASRQTKHITVLAFILVTLGLWLPTIAHNHAGFINPVNTGAIGIDIWSAFVWILFLFTAHHLWRLLHNHT
jgi:hypothetical protein